MKKHLFYLILFLTISNFAVAQTTLEKAFSASYAKEYEKNYPEAIAAIKNSYSPDNYFINLRLGWLYYYSENYQSSAQYYELASKIKPNSVEALLGLAKANYELKKWEPLYVVYKKILLIDPNNTTANYNLGLAAYYKKQFTEAETYTAKVLKLYPFDYDANLLMAGSKLSLAKIEEAKVYYNNVLLIKPNDATAKQVLNSLK